MSRRLAAATAAGWLLAAGPAAAGDVVIAVGPLRGGGGQLQVARCDAASFLRTACPYRLRLPAQPGVNQVRVPDVAPGTYAVQVIHDANLNATLDRNLLDIPTEGYGFSNVPARHVRRPGFAEAAFAVTDQGGGVSVPLTYWL